MDWTPVILAIIAATGVVLNALIAVLVPYAVAAFQARTKIILDTRQIQSIHDAATTAAGLITTQLQQGAIRLTQVTPTSDLVVTAAKVALATVPDSAAAQKVTPQQMARLITARADTKPVTGGT